MLSIIKKNILAEKAQMIFYAFLNHLSILTNTTTEWEIGPTSALNIFPQSFLLRRLNSVNVASD